MNNFASCGKCCAVLVTRNGEKYLPEQLASIVNQSHKIDFLVVLDDDSTDRTKQILIDFSSTANIPMEFLEKSPQKPPSDVKTRIGQNFGAVLSRAVDFHFIFLSDQDDIWTPDRVQHQLKLLQSESVGVVSSNGTLIDANGSPLIGTLRDFFPTGLANWDSASKFVRFLQTLMKPSTTGAATAINGRLLREILPIPEGWLHDRWIALMASSRGALVQDSRLVIAYRIHGEQTVGLQATNRLASRMVMSGNFFSTFRKMIQICKMFVEVIVGPSWK
jgi:glycosyltransferase involved in cell wall biosynthesis